MKSFLTHTFSYNSNNVYSTDLTNPVVSWNTIGVSCVKFTGITSTPHFVRIKFQNGARNVTLAENGDANDSLYILSMQVGDQLLETWVPSLQILSQDPRKNQSSIYKMQFEIYDENDDILVFDKVTFRLIVENNSDYSSERVPDYKMLN